MRILIKSIKRLIKSIKRSISQLKDPKSQDISKSEIYGLFWSLGLHLTIFDPFWVSFGSLSIEFNFFGWNWEAIQTMDSDRKSQLKGDSNPIPNKF